MSVKVLTQEKTIEKNVTGYKVLEYLSQGRKILDNKSADAELQSGEWEKTRDSWPRWTSTIVVNEAPGVKFGKTVKYQGIVFEVPKEYQGLKDTALILDNSTIKMEEQNGEKLITAKVSKSQEYSAEEGWLIPDADTGIPTKVKDSSSDPNARYLWRTSGARVGPVARGFYYGYYGRRVVYVDYGLDVGLGVAFAEQDKQEQAGKLVPLELIAEARSSLAKLEPTTKQELIEPIRKLVRALE